MKCRTLILVCLIFWLVFALAGCTMSGGEITEESKNKNMICTDTRDGETFTYNTNTIRNVRIGIGAPSSFDITTADGRKMTLNANMEAWLKCKEN